VRRKRRAPGYLSISYRRRLLDRDLTEVSATLSGLVLDLGGEWQDRRGQFRPPAREGLRWVCLNVDAQAAPDVLADVEAVPFRDGCADAVVCTEVLEHVLRPEQVVRECARLLRPGGRLILSMPFLARVHADPHDYQRFTASKLIHLLTEAGLVIDDVRKQGLYFTVLAEMLKTMLRELRPGLLRWTVAALALPLLVGLIWLEGRPAVAASPLISSYTTGFLVLAHKPGAQLGVSCNRLGYP